VPDVFKALSDPTRREILRLLRQGELTAGAIADNFAMSKPSVSHHLSTLKAAGLVFAERRGQEIVYSIDTTVFQDVMTAMLELFGPSEEESRDDE
jgi:DNA-binding transcriptional ArsR family regulator